VTTSKFGENLALALACLRLLIGLLLWFAELVKAEVSAQQ